MLVHQVVLVNLVNPSTKKIFLSNKTCWVENCNGRVLSAYSTLVGRYGSFKSKRGTI